MSRLPNILDALAVMRLNSAVWSEYNDALVMAWFRQFLGWYSVSQLGAQARAASNNIAMWYYQVCTGCSVCALWCLGLQTIQAASPQTTLAIAVHVNDLQQANGLANDLATKVIMTQIDVNGNLTREVVYVCT